MSRRSLAVVAGIALVGGFLGFAAARAASLRSSGAEVFTETHPSPQGGTPSQFPTVLAGITPPSSAEPSEIMAPGPDPAWMAQESILDFLFPIVPDDERLRQAFFSVLYRDRKAQNQLLDLLLELEDPEMLESAGEFLIWASAPDQLKRIGDAFTSDSHPGRRAALAAALGNSALDPIARPLVESILMGGDASLQAAALQRMSVGSLSADREFAGLLAPRIRDFLRIGDSAALRMAAAGALRGDPSKEAKQLLIDRMLNDPSPQVQERCAWSLPIDRETLELSWAAVKDDAKNPGVRRAAARLILNGADRRLLSLTPEQRESLQELTLSR
jgi:hypothetical protein